MSEMKQYTEEELARAHGQDGAPALIAYKGKVYDVGQSKLWPKGVHMKRHKSGGDMAEELKGAPHGADVLERLPQVGVIAEKAPAEPEPELPWLLRKVPFLKRHPHPMTVHFPIVFSFAAPVFLFLYLYTGDQAFEATALHMLGASVLFTPIAIITGLYTWRLNYMSQLLTSIKIKLAATPLLFALTLWAFVWRLQHGQAIQPGQGAALYIYAVFALAPLCAVIGWFGAIMTFPPHEH